MHVCVCSQASRLDKTLALIAAIANRMHYSMAEMSMAEMSVGRNVRGRNVRGRNVLAETSVAKMSVAEMAEHPCKRAMSNN